MPTLANLCVASMLGAVGFSPRCEAQDGAELRHQATSRTEQSLNDPEIAPTGFIENRGQWPNQSLFVGRIGRMTVRAERDAFTLQFPDGDGSRGVLIRLSFERSAAADVRVDGSGVIAGRYNYFFGSDPSGWQSNVRAFRSLRYRCLAEEIEMVLYARDGELKYDLLVPPEARLEQFVLRCEGADHLAVDATGALEIYTATGLLTQLRPPSYQVLASGERRAIDVSYKLIDDDRFVFEVPDRDTSLPLVIDPELVWSTYLGSSGGFGSGDTATSVVVDSNHNTIVTGYADWNTFPTTPGAYVVSGLTQKQIFVTKLNRSGSQLVYSSLLGGAAGESRGVDLALDSLQRATVGGYTASASFPTTPGAFDRVKNSFSSAGVVFRLSERGDALVFSTYLEGTTNGSEVYAIAVAKSDATIAGGVTASTGFPVTPGAFDPTLGINAGFLTRIDPQGHALEWSSYLGGNFIDSVMSVALDEQENVTAAGTTTSPLFPTTPGAFQTTFGGEKDAFVSRVSSQGTALIWSTFLGGHVSTDNCYKLGLVRDGSVVVVGTVEGFDFPTTPGSLQPNNHISKDGFVARLDPSGSHLIYSTLIGGGGVGGVHGVAVDSSGIATIAGYAVESFPFTPGAFDTTFAFDLDAFVARLDPTGSKFYYATFLGGAGLEGFLSVAIDSNRRVTAAGYSSGLFPTTPYAFAPNYVAGQADCVVTTLDLYLQGVRPFGSATPNCLGQMELNATRMPKANGRAFGFYVSGAPPSSQGWILVGSPSAFPRVLFGANVVIDLTLPFERVPVTSDSLGFVEMPFPLTKAAAGEVFSSQALFRNTAECSGVGTLSASRGIHITVQ